MDYNNILFKKNKISNILNIYKIYIDRVGLKNIYYPFIFDNSYGKLQKTVGLWNLSISLINNKRGIHMSRFIEILDNLILKFINLKNFFNFYKFFIYKLSSNNITIQVSFFYFLKKISPISRAGSLLNYKITIFLEKNNIFFYRFIKIVVPINSLCPCSKSISNFNSHNQRSHVSIYIAILKKKNININNIIEIIEAGCTSSLWTLLKRNDEKYFTEYSYKNPMFIEDMTRNLYYYFKKKKFFLKIENLESIHNHNAYSFLKKF